MKHTIRLLLILILILLLPISTTTTQAKQSKNEKAIRKQIKLLEEGIKTHNYSKVKKVVKKPYSSYCDFNRIDRLIGKDLLKELSINNHIKIKYIDIYGSTANVTIEYYHCDASTYYFEAHKQLKLENKYSKENFKKKVKEIRKQYTDKDMRICRYIGSTDKTITMKKKKGKWILETDPEALFFDMYSCGYCYFAQICNVIGWNEW